MYFINYQFTKRFIVLIVQFINKLQLLIVGWINENIVILSEGLKKFYMFNVLLTLCQLKMKYFEK